MMYMNDWDIDQSVRRHKGHPVLGPATQTLASLRDAANANSDGWAYWPKPARAAKKLMELIQGPEGLAYYYDDERPDATPAKLRAAYAPIKAFRTRTGISFEIVEVKG